MRIEDMPAGPQMDALVGQHIMNLDVKGIEVCLPDPESTWWHVPDYEPEPGKQGAKYRAIYLNYCACDICAELEQERRQWARDIGEEYEPDRRLYGHNHSCFEVVPAYSTDIAAAWQVVEKIAAPGWHFSLVRSQHGDWWCDFEREMPSGVVASDRGDTAPLAICRAALLACGVTEVPDDAN